MTIRVRPLVALLSAITACGGGPGATTDAADADADAADAAGDVDANEADLVEVTAYTYERDGRSAAGSIAIFYDPDGAVIQHGPVDSFGRASAYMPRGGSVTVLLATNPINAFHRLSRLTTIHGVKPGDRLVTGHPVRTSRTGTTSVMHASYNQPGTLGMPTVLGACANATLATAPIPLVFYDGCQAPMFDLLLLANDASNVRHFAFQRDIPYMANGQFSLATDYQPVAVTPTTISGIPANQARVGAQSYAVVDGVAIQLDHDAIEAPSPGTATLTVDHAPAQGIGSMVRALTVEGLASVRLEHVRVTLGSAPTDVDLGSLPLPTMVVAAPTPREVTWTQFGPGAPDARLFHWSKWWTDADQVNHESLWQVMDPPDGPASSTLEPLPAEYASDDPTRAVTNVQQFSVTPSLVDYDNLNGYDDARPHGYQLEFIDTQFLDVEHLVHIARY